MKKIENINIENICEILLNFNKCLKFGKKYKINNIVCIGNQYRESVFIYNKKEFVCEIDSALCFSVVLQGFFEFDFSLKILLDTIIRDNCVITHKVSEVAKCKFNDNQRLRMPKSENAKNQS